MEESWEHWPLHSELGDVEVLLGQYCHQTSADDEEEFLRDIILQQPVTYSGSISSSNEMDGSDCSKKKLHPSSSPSTPRTFILSFDKSTIIPATTTPESEEVSRPKSKSNNNKRSLEPKAKASNQTGKKSRSGSQYLDHIMAERKRRLELSQKFIALSATIPGLKKMDKNYILGEAISYVKLLQERVKELEDQNKNSKESTIILKKTDMCVSEDTTSNSDQDCCKSPLFDVKARIMENEVLIQMHCEKENDIEIKIYNVLENLDLFVTASSVLAFGTSTLGFTIVAQVCIAICMSLIS